MQFDGRLTLARLAEMLDVDQNEPGLARLTLAASREVSLGLPAVVLSLLRRDGYSIGSEGEAELLRIRTRSAAYRDLVAAMSDLGGVVCKGAATGAFYPSALHRHVGDLDLCLPSADAVWRAAARVATQFPISEVVVQRAPLTDDAAVSLWWPARNPLYEPELHVDLFTTPYWGDGSSLGIRRYDPTVRPEIQSMLLLLEEWLQRSWRATDDIDLTFLLPKVDLTELEPEVARLGLRGALGDLLERVGAPRLAAAQPRTETATPGDDEVVEVGFAIDTSLPFPERPFELIFDNTLTVMRAPFGAFLMSSRSDVTEAERSRAEWLLAQSAPDALPDVTVRRLV